MPDIYNEMIHLFPAFFEQEGLIKIPFLFISSIIFAELSWAIVEKPLQKLKMKFNYAG